MQKIIPCLWFDDKAEEAAAFYASVFNDAKILAVTHYGKEGKEVHGRPEGSVLTVELQLQGQRFTLMNGGPLFTFSEAVSFIVSCKTQEEVDHYWEKLSAVKESEQCGWLKDKYGVSWQIVPEILEGLMSDKDKEKAGRVMNALLEMKKLDIKGLQDAYDGK
jgi:predicted 3-demethylubiquinone-9 3-methyltransferase (glyoxalase superfamily)